VNTLFRWIALLIVVVGLLLTTLKQDKVGAEAAQQIGLGLYDSNPEHLWNRLYRHLYVRIGPANRAYGYDELEPPLWNETTHLLESQSHQQALRLLDEFLTANGEKLITDPLKRAIFQRDLWVVFDWLASRSDTYKSQRQELQKRLAQIIRRLALKDIEIRQLPDNYRHALDLGAYPTEYLLNQPTSSFLPTELLQSNGAWVSVGGRNPGAATQHIFFTHGHSAFLVFMRLSGGRETTLAYLDNLGKAASANNPPQFPSGTQVALIRKTILIDDKGDLVVSPITESVQIRVYRKVDASQKFESDGQDFYEFTLRRTKLFDKRSVSLLPLNRDESAISTFMTHGNDFGGVVRPLQLCSACHFGEGIHSVLSYKFPNINSIGNYSPIEIEAELKSILQWKLRQYSWGLMEGLWLSTQ
jgi:hypothetical protein